MTEHENDRKPKQPYEKPRVEAIELKADEVLAVGCKTASGANTGQMVTCGSTNFCVEVGS